MDRKPDFIENSRDDSFEVTLNLSAAYKAQTIDNPRLAIHLYIAAFEYDRMERDQPGDNSLEGLKVAWRLARETGDKPSAETLFAMLAPYSDPEETHARVQELQEMAREQLEDMGVPSDCIEQMKPIHSPEATAAGADPDFLARFQEMLRSSAERAGIIGSEDGDEGMPPLPWGRPPQEAQTTGGPCYDDLVGYDDAMNSMRVYGFDAPTEDEEFRRFVQETSEFHGLEGLTLYDPFLFYGPSRDDVYEFAEATAGEIGNPVLTLHVRADEEGMWTIRLSGPFRRGLFGVSDPTDIPTPCTFVIENIDILQDFVKTAIQSDMGMDEPPRGGSQMYAEILGYIHAIMQKPGVFAILTAGDDVALSAQFEELFGRAQRVKVDLPSLDERHEIWKNFSLGHASFSEIDLDELSRLSGGISRHDMVAAGRSAVRDAYQESLSSNAYRFVSINDVLFEMVPFVSRDDSSSYSAIADAAAEAFVGELSDFMFTENPDDRE